MEPSFKYPIWYRYMNRCNGVVYRGGQEAVGNYWFPERIPNPKLEYPYQPSIQLQMGVISLPVWFKTYEQCEQFIREQLIPAEVGR